jgi:large subunit ribosomal protein L4
MELPIIDEQGQRKATLTAPDELFGREYNEAVVHQVVTAYMANARLGTRAQKGRSDVNKSNKKPWRQKGTGRARAGRASSPLWRGGGKIFPSSPDELALVNQSLPGGNTRSCRSSPMKGSGGGDFGVQTKVLAQKLRDGSQGSVVTDSMARTWCCPRATSRTCSWWSPGMPTRSACLGSRRR